MFTSFKVESLGLFVTHLQYVDDTLFMRTYTIENLWTIKTILSSFKLASGLRVIFF